MNNTGNSSSSSSSTVLELNVGGVFYSTDLATLRREPDSHIAKLFTDPGKVKAMKDSKGKYFIDRDGVLFRYILDYLRNLKLVLPENFHEKERLKQEAEFFHLPNLVSVIESYPRHMSPVLFTPASAFLNKETSSSSNINSTGVVAGAGAGTAGAGKLLIPQASVTPSTRLNKQNSNDSNQGGGKVGAADEAGGQSATISPAPSPVNDRGPGYITVGYRGTFAFGRDGLADVKFRKMSRIIVCGKVSLCREVFKDTLNESRDPDRGETDRYTSRFFLKHSFLEQAFDMLQEEGFSLVASCGSGTNSAGEVKPGLDTEEAKWQHYNEFIFERR
ncbi:BTB/POZ domain-containing protein kctd12 [Plakobranchus ocellatus]|uniref:BTB/POZ domain-containing protein kctd12 n=1 Tax=Plakobranchus ocellatus TaxID=259542 RepID=A0AAV3ZFZ0_9GAST|nr:BTB/POZ domain-containing protein kctd12 [Plakobranchus ocellatus]